MIVTAYQINDTLDLEPLRQGEARSAYTIALGAMMLIGSGMYLFFRNRGWFG